MWRGRELSFGLGLSFSRVVEGECCFWGVVVFGLGIGVKVGDGEVLGMGTDMRIWGARCGGWMGCVGAIARLVSVVAV